MKEMTKKALNLALIGAIAALLLAVTNFFTEPVIKQRKADELTKMLSVLSQGKKTGPPEENPAPGVLKRWPLENNQGWILEMKTTGYGGPMTVVAAYTPKGAVITARMMDNAETPGFGLRYKEDSYMDTIFSGTGADKSVPVSKTELSKESADMVSGATITFRGLALALRNGSELVKEWEAGK